MPNSFFPTSSPQANIASVLSYPSLASFHLRLPALQLRKGRCQCTTAGWLIQEKLKKGPFSAGYCKFRQEGTAKNLACCLPGAMVRSLWLSRLLTQDQMRLRSLTFVAWILEDHSYSTLIEILLVSATGFALHMDLDWLQFGMSSISAPFVSVLLSVRMSVHSTHFLSLGCLSCLVRSSGIYIEFKNAHFHWHFCPPFYCRKPENKRGSAGGESTKVRLKMPQGKPCLKSIPSTPFPRYLYVCSFVSWVNIVKHGMECWSTRWSVMSVLIGICFKHSESCDVGGQRILGWWC